MKLIPSLVCSLLALSPLAYSASQTQVFPTAAGPVSITPLNHASEIGGIDFAVLRSELAR